MGNLQHFFSLVVIAGSLSSSLAFHRVDLPFQVNSVPTKQIKASYLFEGVTAGFRQPKKVRELHAIQDDHLLPIVDQSRRQVWIQTASRVASITLATALAAVLTRPVWAMSKSRTEGYEVQKTEAEWRSILSPLQYEILREGSTENPYFSILEKNDDSGIYRCAGCGTELFASRDKFHSGTGWPSFARALRGVETEAVDPITATLAGAELRCRTCGGHLGDVFQDGYLFVGTEAAKTGQRYCIDGAALIFYPDSGQSPVRGDQSAKSKGESMPSWLEPPKITPRDRQES